MPRWPPRFHLDDCAGAESGRALGCEPFVTFLRAPQLSVTYITFI